MDYDNKMNFVDGKSSWCRKFIYESMFESIEAVEEQYLNVRRCPSNKGL